VVLHVPPSALLTLPFDVLDATLAVPPPTPSPLTTAAPAARKPFVRAQPRQPLQATHAHTPPPQQPPPSPLAPLTPLPPASPHHQHWGSGDGMSAAVEARTGALVPCAKRPLTAEAKDAAAAAQRTALALRRCRRRSADVARLLDERRAASVTRAPHVEVCCVTCPEALRPAAEMEALPGGDALLEAVHAASLRRARVDGAA
jgi:hypothetical protein